MSYLISTTVQPNNLIVIYATREKKNFKIAFRVQQQHTRNNTCVRLYILYSKQN